MVNQPADQSLSMLRYGTDQALPERRTLAAGPLTAVLEEGGLRYIRFGGREVARGIYAAVRDSNWGTIPGELSELSIEQDDRSFNVSFASNHRQGEIDYTWYGFIEGHADGSLTFAMNGEANRDFLKNRIGFCILLPLEMAGCPVEVATGGEWISSVLPVAISPHQPFPEMTGLRVDLEGGLRAELAFEGDMFEMEDQRNWTDASYKIYCTPLALPFPVEVRANQRLTQTVRLNVSGIEGMEPGPDATESGRVVLEVDAGRRARLPALGVAVAPTGPVSALQLERLRQLRLSYLRAMLRLTSSAWKTQLAEASAAAAALGVGLELEVIVGAAGDATGDAGEEGGVDGPARVAASGGAAGRLGSLIREIRAGGMPVNAVFVYLADEFVTDAASARELIRLRDEAGLTFRIGGGTRANFTEFNRADWRDATMEVAGYHLNPQIHAFDLSSMTETLQAHGVTVATARSKIGGLPLSIGPVTFKPRANPYATSAEGARRTEERSGQFEPRQHSLFGAGWTLGSLKHLAEAGADFVSCYETSGPLGIMPPEADTVYPAFHILAAVGEFAGAQTWTARSGDVLKAEALALADGSRLRVLAANYLPETAELEFLLPPVRGLRCRTLDERGGAAALGSADRAWQAGGIIGAEGASAIAGSTGGATAVGGSADEGSSVEGSTDEGSSVGSMTDEGSPAGDAARRPRVKLPPFGIVCLDAELASDALD